jgi:hypothetical protein
MSERFSPLSMARTSLAANVDLEHDVVPVYLRVRGPLRPRALELAIATVVARHPEMNMRVVRHGDGLGQGRRGERGRARARAATAGRPRARLSSIHMRQHLTSRNPS